MSEALVEIFRHNAWANERILDACAGLNAAQLNVSADGTFGTVLDTLVHIVGAQERFAAALAEAPQPGVNRERRPFAGFADLRDAARASSDALVELAAQVDSREAVTVNDRGTIYDVPVWLLVVQAINHATEHRAQIATILTQHGIDPPGMDGWTYHETCFDGDWSELWSS